jgi:hypothetical protein
MPRYEDVLHAALELSYEDRATLQEVLLDTLHPPGSHAEDELENLVEARLEDLMHGRVELLDADETLRRIRAGFSDDRSTSDALQVRQESEERYGRGRDG